MKSSASELGVTCSTSARWIEMIANEACSTELAVIISVSGIIVLFKTIRNIARSN